MPTVNQIADRLGIDAPRCLVCGSDYVERAHVVPHALGGSSDIGNLALLCPLHHREAPDVADAHAFWAWVDAAYSKWNDAIRALSEDVVTTLAETFGWTTEMFETANKRFGDLQERWSELVAQETSTHFGIGRKASTMAWAWNAAYTDVFGPRTRSFEV
jgi:hypothetical protein